MADTRNLTDAPPTVGPRDVGLTVGDIARESGDEAERRVAALRGYLTEIASAGKLCEVVDRMS
jgi:MerR family transcriptional regulator, redox-sensitive transcriptional activator SoxR